MPPTRSDRPNVSSRRSVYRSYLSHWRAIAGAGVFAMLGAAGEATALIIVAASAPSLGKSGAQEIDLGFGSVALEATVVTMFGIAASLITIATVCRGVSAWISSKAQSGWAADRRHRSMMAYLNASYTFISSKRTAEIHELTGQHTHIAGSVISHLSGAINAVVSLVVFMVSALILDVTASAVFFVLGSLSILALRPVMNWTKATAKIFAEKSVELGVTVEETTGVVREIKTLGVQEQFQHRFDDRVYSLAGILQRLNFALNITPQVFVGVGMLVLLGTLAVASNMSSGSFATLGGTAILLFRALTYGQQLSGIQQRLGRAIPYAEALSEFIDEAEAAGAETSAGTVSLDAIDSIEFDATSFSYEADETPAIRSASFTLQRPGLLAVVGPSGTGKTTVAHLALGLLRPTAGEIRINGIPMGEIASADFSKLIALVPQEPVILHATAMDNIRFYRDQISEAQVIAAAKSVGIHETIMALDNGYETEIGQTSRGLSGGQRQRIAIARAIVGEPSLIILDEPTSALDNESESWVMNSLVEISKESLALVIAHRKETIDRCDGILRFEDGQLVELV